MSRQNAYLLETHQRLHDSHCAFLVGLRELLTGARPGSDDEADLRAAIATTEQAASAAYAEVQRLQAGAMGALIKSATGGNV